MPINKMTTMGQISDEHKADFCTFIFDFYLGMTSDELRKKVAELLPGFKDKKIIHSKDEIKCIVKAASFFGLDTNVPLMDSVNEEYRPLALGFMQQLINEYDCNSSSEKALAQVVVNAFVRIVAYSNTLSESRKVKAITGNINGYYSMIGKELDRANRQFISALTTLKQLKSPALKINVTAQNAFVGEKQQFNKNDCNNSHENIEPK